MGASREVTFASLVELGLFIALAALGIMAHDFSLSQMLGKRGISPRRRRQQLGDCCWPSASSSLALAECSRVPVDDPATHLELTMIHEVMVLDHSGPDLAMILYASALKLALFAAHRSSASLIPAPTSGAGRLARRRRARRRHSSSSASPSGSSSPSMARLRLPKVPLYIAGGSSLALFGLILQLTLSATMTVTSAELVAAARGAHGFRGAGHVAAERVHSRDRVSGAAARRAATAAPRARSRCTLLALAVGTAVIKAGAAALVSALGHSRGGGAARGRAADRIHGVDAARRRRARAVAFAVAAALPLLRQSPRTCSCPSRSSR